MIVTIRDSMNKILHLNPQFITCVKDSGRGYAAIYDISGNMSYVSDPKEIQKIVDAMTKCLEVFMMPPQAGSVGLPFDFTYAELDLEDEVEEIPEPPKSAKRAKKSPKS